MEKSFSMGKGWDLFKSALKNWGERNNWNVLFIGEFVFFGERDDHEDMCRKAIAYGKKEAVQITLKELERIVENEEDFLNF